MIALVDVCSGNLRSVERALVKAGGEVVVTRDGDVVRSADKLVVPGQGAFGVFMRSALERELAEPLREAIGRGRPFLGICLGMQILFDESEEQGPVRGLGVIPGRVARIVATHPSIKVPHIGWNRVAQRGLDSSHGLRGAPVLDPMLAGVADGAHVYFDHSYHAVPADPSVIALETDHGCQITAAIRQGNIFACQFHPEKSQAVGLQILRNFVERA